MKYLENYRYFESIDGLKTKLTKDFIFDIEDIFLEFLDENRNYIHVEKSYYSIESESWDKVDSLYDASDDAFSISIYFSQYLRNDFPGLAFNHHQNLYTPINPDILNQIIESIKRSVIYYDSLSINNVVGYNIQYRDIKRGYVSANDIDIKIEDIDNLLKDYIYSIDITFYTI